MISQSQGVLGALALTTWFPIEMIWIWEMWGVLMFQGAFLSPWVDFSFGVKEL